MATTSAAVRNMALELPASAQNGAQPLSSWATLGEFLNSLGLSFLPNVAEMEAPIKRGWDQ